MLSAIVLVLAAVAAPLLTNPSIAQSTRPADEAAIKEVIQHAYVDGLVRQRDPEMMREGFAETFVMQVYWDGELSSRTRDAWLQRMKLDKTPNENEIRGEVTVLDVTGVAATARIDIHENAEHKYSDYFGLYRTEDGWKIVSKHFHAHGYEGHERQSPV